jgi:beta-aspartyl-peptidase (threonine type)
MTDSSHHPQSAIQNPQSPTSSPQYPIPNTLSPVLIVHGGAYDIPKETHEAHVAGCRRAAEIGWAVLSRGGSALEAVEAAVRVMEDDPTFDAGYGSYLNARAEIELDAMIMDGRDLNFGAVAAVQRVRYPVTLARLVMTESEHAMLVGAGAEAFAREHGLPICPPEELLADRELERWQAARAGSDGEKEARFLGKNPVSAPPDTRPSDTVGAVALDADGNLAAATSTGGTFNKLPGRVGDSPLVGCGAYADNRSGAVSATGMGEALMKVVISKAACDFVAAGMTAQEAADAAVAILAERTTGHGGLILLDRRGRAGVAHNTPYIAHAVVTTDGEIITNIEHRRGNE